MFGFDDDKQDSQGERIEEVREIDEDGRYKDNDKGGERGTDRDSGGFRGFLGKMFGGGGDGDSGGYSGGGGGGEDGYGKLIFAVLILGVGIVLYGVLGEGDVTGELVGTFDASPEEHIGAMMNGIKDVQKSNHMEGDMHPIYDTRDIYTHDQIFKQGLKEYFVYIHTRDEEVDEEFNDWYRHRLSDTIVYTLESKEAVRSERLTDRIPEISEDKPMLLLITGESGAQDILNYATDKEQAYLLEEQYILKGELDEETEDSKGDRKESKEGEEEDSKSKSNGEEVEEIDWDAYDF